LAADNLINGHQQITALAAGRSTDKRDKPFWYLTRMPAVEGPTAVSVTTSSLEFAAT